MLMVFILCLIIITAYDCFHNVTRNCDNPRLARRARSLKAEAVARAWNVLLRLRSLILELGNVTIPPPAQKTFDAEGETLEHALTKSFRIRNCLVHLGTPLPGRYQRMKAWPISPRVNSRTNNDPEIMAPIGA